MKRAIKITAFALSMLICHTSYASLIPTVAIESKKISCNFENIDEKDKVVLFVNGIWNSIADAEDTRLELEKMFSNSQTIMVRKVYNDTDGFWEDVDELENIGDLQFASKRWATTITLDIFDVRLNQYYDKTLTPKEASRIKELSGRFFAWLMAKQLLASDANQLLYDPKLNATDFQQAFKNNILKKLEEDEKTAGKNDNLRKGIEAVMKSYGDALERFYYLAYRRAIVKRYAGNVNFYQRDESVMQRVTKSVERLQQAIVEYVLSGKKVVIVPHSQGNHITELAYSKLQQQYGANSDFMKAIRVVGVASVSSSTPNNVYITSNEDHTVLNLYDVKTQDVPLQANFIDKNFGGFWGNAGLDHAMTKFYLSEKNKGLYTLPANAHTRERFASSLQYGNTILSTREIIHMLILDSMKLATPIPSQINNTTSPLTAQLRWGVEHGDMDLYIQEPNETEVVYYDKKKGKYGELDLDDRDGHGPEHYSVNKDFASCDKLQGKTWMFSVRQHPEGGNKEVIHFMLKLADNQISSRSITLNPWPADPVEIATVQFANTIQNNRLDYSISYHQ